MELANRGFIDETVQFIPNAERFQVNANLVELLLNQNQEIISKHTSSYTTPNNQSSDKTEKTKFEVKTSVNYTDLYLLFLAPAILLSVLVFMLEKTYLRTIP